MRYVALLRGINVGGNHKVEMKKLRSLLASMGFTAVSTYLNSGNAIFESAKTLSPDSLTAPLSESFGFDIPTLTKTADEMKAIAQAIPPDWQNGTDWKCDVAYLFGEIDTEKTVKELPVQREFIDIRYVKGAIFWRVSRKDYNKSRINKLIGHRLYRLMTMRNVNTARFLGT